MEGILPIGLIRDREKLLSVRESNGRKHLLTMSSGWKIVFIFSSILSNEEEKDELISPSAFGQ